MEKVVDPSQIGNVIRQYRKKHGVTLEKLSGLTRLGMRFLSEVERGKETAEIGKVLQVLFYLGLDVIIQPRSESNKEVGGKYKRR